MIPGTVGTVVAVPLYLAFSSFAAPVYILTVLALSALAVYVAGSGELALGRRDPPAIVIDEIVGFLWTMVLIPPSLWSIVTCFLLFRVFDIVKPFPIRRVEEKLAGGWAIVMDDVVAGLYARAVFEIGRLIWAN